MLAIGINYEAGKIINCQLLSSKCIAYANCQIVMDKPFGNNAEESRIADENLRNLGRSEKQFDPDCDQRTQSILKLILTHIQGAYADIDVVFQVARGRAAQNTIDEVILPLLQELNIKKYVFQTGYRSTNYYLHNSTNDYIFINIGMFAILKENIPLQVGEICNPVISISIEDYSHENGFTIGESSEFHDSKNLLLRFPELKHVQIYGLADHLPFVTPTSYHQKHIASLLIETRE